MKITLQLAVLSVVFACNAFAQLAHDVSVDSIISPSANAASLTIFPLIIRVTNRGTSNESSFPVAYALTDSLNNIIFRDEFWISLTSGQTVDFRINQSPAPEIGTFTLCAASEPPRDQNKHNDSTCIDLKVVSNFDVEPVGIYYPKDGDTVRAGENFQPIVIFRNNEAMALQRAQAFYLLSSLKDSTYLLPGGTTSDLPLLPADSVPVYDTFPSEDHWGFDSRKLVPGSYQIESRIYRPNVLKTASSKFTIFAQHDISADSILMPVQFGKPKAPAMLVIPTKAQFTNRGASDESSFKIAIKITDTLSTTVFADTVTISSLKSNQSITVSFADWKPQGTGRYQTCAKALLPIDEDSFDDQRCHPLLVKNLNDIQALKIEYPTAKDTITEGTSFDPEVEFRNVGASDLDSVPVCVNFRKCSDHSVVGTIFDTVDYLSSDSIDYPLYFYSRSFDAKTLTPGCYEVLAFSQQPDDANSTNDTIYSTFFIKPDPTKLRVESYGPTFKAHLTPNPSLGIAFLTVSSVGAKPLSLELYDMMGRSVLMRDLGALEVGNSSIPLDLGRLPNGRYLLRVSGANNITLPLTICR